MCALMRSMRQPSPHFQHFWVHYAAAQALCLKFTRPWSIIPDVGLMYIAAICSVALLDVLKRSPMVTLATPDGIHTYWGLYLLVHPFSHFFPRWLLFIARPTRPAPDAAVASRLKMHHGTWWFEAGGEGLQTPPSINHDLSTFGKASPLIPA
ncbi:hypothetical protein C8R43DRAFT_949414 [Mycena crocata]|nr:hypothetical protein C8R43DRAFT_949414 [Mycena crocata]